MLIDIHTHIKSDVDGRKELLSLFHYNRIPETDFFSIGIHPWHADKNKTNSLIDELYPKAGKAFAIGECGLDKNSSSSFEKQKEVFIEQIKISEKLRKPLIIHSVKTYNEIIEIHKDFNPEQAWIIHGFTGSTELMESFVKAGVYLSFGSMLLRGIEKTENVFEKTPMGNFFIETDESTKDILDIYNQAARIKNTDVESIISATEKNLQSITNR